MRRTGAPVAAVGVVAALAYVTAVVTAMAGGHHGVRPLYEGVGPPPSYQWVHPPAAFVTGNTVPGPQSMVIPLHPTGNAAVGLTSADSQLILNLPAGAIAPHGSDVSVKTEVVPVDPATLGPMTPLGLVPNGNAYRVDLIYQPSNVPVAQLAKAGDLILTVPLPAHAIAFAPDGKNWQIQLTQQVGGGSFLGTTFKVPGYYLAGSQHNTATGGTVAGSGSGNVGLIAGACVVLALALIGAPILWRRRRPHA